MGRITETKLCSCRCYYGNAVRRWRKKYIDGKRKAKFI